MTWAAGHRLVSALLSDGALVLDVEAALADTVEPWLPLVLPAIGREPAGARVRVRRGGPPARPPGDPVLTLGPVETWIDGASAIVRARHEPVGCAIDLGAPAAEVRVAATTTITRALYSMLTVTSALLLNRMGRALVHAGAVVGPDGGAWLVVGDGRSGKSTTCVNLVSAGWGLLADDQIVLARSGQRVVAEGWPRTIHLDQGWEIGHPTGRRRDLDPRTLGVEHRPVGVEGVLLTRVEPDGRTVLEPATAADVFSQLVRQSPWLLADPGANGPVRDLLSGVSRQRRGTVVLGPDTFNRPDLLLERLAPLF